MQHGQTRRTNTRPKNGFGLVRSSLARLQTGFGGTKRTRNCGHTPATVSCISTAFLSVTDMNRRKSRIGSLFALPANKTRGILHRSNLLTHRNPLRGSNCGWILCRPTQWSIVSEKMGHSVSRSASPLECEIGMAQESVEESRGSISQGMEGLGA
jgi:hypothetical protein